MHILFKDQDFRKEKLEFTEGKILLLSSIIYWKDTEKMEADFSLQHAAKGQEAIEKAATTKIVMLGKTIRYENDKILEQGAHGSCGML